jgi:two-component system OmpR family sensor kinase
MLRTRLVAILAALVLAGLAISSFATYKSLESFLLHRTDAQLRDSAEPVSHILLSNDSVAGGLTADLPVSTYGEIRTTGGKVVASKAITQYGKVTIKPQLPASIGRDDINAPFTTGAVNSADQSFRTLISKTVLNGPLGSTDAYVIIAIPLTDVTGTLHRLLLVELVVALAILAALAGATWWVVRRELKPLERMGETATSIAGGDLDRRVEPAEEATEVGRLGLALNGMLARIETAMKARSASEERLRRFLADASHELRTPLTSIRGYAELFRHGAAERPDDLEVSMRRIEEEAARMGVLVDDLLLLAHMDETRPALFEDIDLSELVRDAASDARAVAPDRRVNADVNGVMTVKGDTDRLREAIGNLVGNAISHTPPGTDIDLFLERRDRLAQVTVADRGPGLDPEAAEHAFERFWRSAPNRERGPSGSGLGLSIVAAIVQVHGGTVSAGNREGGGATFRMQLPLAEE